MADKKYKTSKADFEYFKRQCWWWVRYFGVIDKEYTFYHKDIEGTRATAVTEFESGHRVISLSTDFGGEFAKRELAQVAFHEVYETMLFELTSMASYAYKDGHIAENSHKLVNIMVNTLFAEKWQSVLRYEK